ncbi:MAG: hypothetical protein HC923_10390, partial [Myxococcales bacterium]|nr:hypothetical protein [Myxococcales bacterium]
SDEPLPPALANAHFEARAAEPRVFSLPEDLLATSDEVQFRGANYGGTWGNYSGYCATDFDDHFEAWAGNNPADVSLAGSVGGGASVSTIVDDATHVWLAVCNDEGWGSGNTTLSELALYRDISGAPTWSSLNCTLSSPWTYCSNIFKQTAHAMEYWSSTTYDFKAAAEWTAGVVHDAELRVYSQ